MMGMILIFQLIHPFIASISSYNFLFITSIIHFILKLIIPFIIVHGTIFVSTLILNDLGGSIN